MAEKYGTLPELFKKRRLTHDYDQQFLDLPNSQKLRQYNEQYRIDPSSTVVKDGVSCSEVRGKIVKDSAGFHNYHISGKINPETLNENSYRFFGFPKYDSFVNMSAIDDATDPNSSRSIESHVKKYHALECGNIVEEPEYRLDKETKQALLTYSSESGYKAFQNYVKNGYLNKEDIVLGTTLETPVYEQLMSEDDESFKNHVEKMDEYLQDGYGIQRRLFRGISQEDHGIDVEEWLKEHPIGSTFTNETYTATSASYGVALARAQQGGNTVGDSPSIVFDMVSSQGRALGNNARYQLEQEVVLPRNATFMVVGVDKDVVAKNGIRNYSISAFVKVVQVDEDNNIL